MSSEVAVEISCAFDFEDVIPDVSVSLSLSERARRSSNLPISVFLPTKTRGQDCALCMINYQHLRARRLNLISFAVGGFHLSLAVQPKRLTREPTRGKDRQRVSPKRNSVCFIFRHSVQTQVGLVKQQRKPKGLSASE